MHQLFYVLCNDTGLVNGWFNYLYWGDYDKDENGGMVETLLLFAIVKRHTKFIDG